MSLMFSIGYGISNRDKKIRSIARTDPNHALILAAVHFEWIIKRSILKLGCSPTAGLRNELEGIYKLGTPGNKKDYRSVWKREVASRFRNSQLGTVLGNLHTLESKTLNVRGKVIHGNGTVPNDTAIHTPCRLGGVPNRSGENVSVNDIFFDLDLTIAT